MTQTCEVAIIGAGPYGLSIAAHLSANDVEFRIFGSPMQTWRTRMLKDSHLKSDGFASSLYEPSGKFTLGAYCGNHALPYADTGLPVPCTTFADYGMAFQKRYVPSLEKSDVLDLRAGRKGFSLTLDNGATVSARRVVVATGLSRFEHMPDVFADLGPEYVSHSSSYVAVDRFSGCEVVVIGLGASAIDLAKELVLNGSHVRVVGRRDTIWFPDPPRPRSVWERIAAPTTGIGPGWRSKLCVDAPLVFHAMPEGFRVAVVRRHLGPLPCWFTREAVDGRVEFLFGRQLRSATLESGRVRLTLSSQTGAPEDICADHVIAATGYRVDLSRLGFLSPELRAAISLCDSSPALTRHFESSVPGLYFVGLPAANSFGPVSRFAFGARFTAPHLSAHLARQARRKKSNFRSRLIAAQQPTAVSPSGSDARA